MYEGLRLTELHEEWAWNRFHAAARDRTVMRQETADALDAEIRARVAAQIATAPSGPVRLGKQLIYVSAGWEAFGWTDKPEPLVFGIPDAQREYRTLYERTEHALNYDQPHHWTNHKRHAVPVEGCHLCREGRR